MTDDRASVKSGPEPPTDRTTLLRMVIARQMR
jgi:hypothetical protein